MEVRMRWLSLVLLLGGCVTMHKSLITEPVLLVDASRPVPAGMVASNPTKAEVRVCGPEYSGLHDLVARAKKDADALVEITVDVERHYNVYRSAWDRRTSIVLDTQCYVLHADRVTFTPQL